MEGKKISFGFKKVQRSGDLRLAAPTKSATEGKKDFIECLEENTIKVVGGDAVEENLPLVIPMKPNMLNIDRYQQIAAEIEASQSEESKPDIKEVMMKSETLEQQAARELLEEARNVKTEETKIMALPLLKEPPLQGQKESSLEDYENIPIADFGMAMLRGMGWTAGQASKYTQPALRPKGLGLGADTLVKPNSTMKGSNKEETEPLDLKKGCYVRVLAGKYNGAYGKLVSLNEEAARVTVELTLGHHQVELGEQVLQAVTKEEFNERSRILNSEKYDEYKKKEQSNSSSGKNSPKAYSRYDEKEPKSKRKQKEGTSFEDHQSQKGQIRGFKEHNKRNGSENHSGDIKNEPAQRYRRDSSSIEKDLGRDKSHKNSNRNSSDEHKGRKTDRQDTSSDDEGVRVRKHKSKKRDSSLESLRSNSLEPEKQKKSKNRAESSKKRDIDKKRKGKKKKRDRDRSPVYRKHKR